jgi:hypothetical protein
MGGKCIYGAGHDRNVMIAKNTMDKIYKSEISLGYMALLD